MQIQETTLHFYHLRFKRKIVMLLITYEMAVIRSKAKFYYMFNARLNINHCIQLKNRMLF